MRAEKDLRGANKAVVACMILIAVSDGFLHILPFSIEWFMIK